MLSLVLLCIVQLTNANSLSFGVELATRPKTIEKCGPLDEKASKRWGANYAWCEPAINESITGLSFGICTFDTWSERLANVYNIKTHLYDCYTPPRLKQYTVPYIPHNDCVDAHPYSDTQNRNFITLESVLGKFDRVFLKLDIEGNYTLYVNLFTLLILRL